MKANIENGTVKSGEFRYAHTPRTLKAYGETFTIPVRTVDFEEKLNAARTSIGGALTTSDVIKEILKGIALFIGEASTEKIFPSEKLGELDVDEVMSFWQALNFELQRTQNEMLSRYRPAQNIRR